MVITVFGMNIYFSKVAMVVWPGWVRLNKVRLVSKLGGDGVIVGGVGLRKYVFQSSQREKRLRSRRLCVR